MHSFIYISLILILLSDYFIVYSFYPEELKLVNYEVDILKVPVKAGEEQLHPILHLTSKHGQKYQCMLPQVEERDSTEKKETATVENIDVKELIKPMMSNPCFIKAKGWWSYEFCPGRYIKQYHFEDGKILGQIITLGIYQSDYDWNNETEENKFQHGKQRYHAQYYVNGSHCDLIGLPRSAEVRFYCEKDSGDYIYRVDEPGTCNYLLTVHTSRICSHSKLKPLPMKKAHKVACSPLLNEQQYAHYLQQVDEEKLAAEEKRNTWLATQQEKLKAIKAMTQDDAIVQMEDDAIVQMEDDAIVQMEDDLEEIGDTVSTSDATKSTSEIAGQQGDDSQKVQNVDVIAEENDGSDEKTLWKDYDQELEKLKTVVPPEKFSTVMEDIQKHIDSLITETEEELEINLDGESKTAAYGQLASTLSVLLNKLDKAEQDVIKAAQALEKAQSTRQQSSKSDAEATPEDKLHVRIRQLNQKYPETNAELGEIGYAKKKQIEQAVKEKLQKAGLETLGRKFQVKIITAGHYDSEDGKDFHSSLSDEDTSHFQNMIMALLTGQQEAVQEIERHKKLEENYKFVWNDKELKEKSRSEEDYEE